MNNHEIAEKMREMSIYYEMEDTPFKPAAYERAADAVDASGTEMKDLFRDKGKKGLKSIPGIGEGIASSIADLLKAGTFPEYKRFRKKYPVDIMGLSNVEGIGPKTIQLLYRKLKIKTLADLKRTAAKGKIRNLPGMGAKSEENILKGLAVISQTSGRYLLGYALPLATRIRDEIRALRSVEHAEYAGSLRRRRDTIGDIDILVTTSDPEEVMAKFLGFPEIKEVLEHGKTKTVVRLRNGMHADVRVVKDEEYGAALQYFTGSKEHNVEVRKIAIAKGLKLNEYGIWKGKKRIASRTEADVYKAIGLPYMEPELRTASGEIEAARKVKLPRVIPYGSVRGDLQTQTDWTDGEDSLEHLAQAAEEMGMEYIAITDHTKALAMTGGLDEKKLAKQGKAIDALNRKLTRKGSKFRVLKSAEVNIMKDGSLDINDAALAKLDMVGAAIHSHFRLSRDEQTARMIRAMENSHVDVIFHPTCRIIGKREPIEFDMDAVLRAAKKTGTALEIDAFPGRSDLRDTHVRKAVEAGVKLMINTDAHAAKHLQFLALGESIARRGWAEKKDILNTRKLDGLIKWLKTPKKKRR